LAAGGRLAVISFLAGRPHREELHSRCQHHDKLPSWVPVRACDIPEAAIKPVGKAIRCSEAEVAANPRARSAIMRVAQRIGGQWQGTE
jgi:16S rRNA (cytosine1402-N4)-methyltransferase